MSTLPSCSPRLYRSRRAGVPWYSGVQSRSRRASIRPFCSEYHSSTSRVVRASIACRWHHPMRAMRQALTSSEGVETTLGRDERDVAASISFSKFGSMESSVIRTACLCDACWRANVKPICFAQEKTASSRIFSITHRGNTHRRTVVLYSWEAKRRCQELGRSLVELLGLFQISLPYSHRRFITTLKVGRSKLPTRSDPVNVQTSRPAF